MKTETRPPMEPLLVNAGGAAQLCGVSENTWWKMKDSGRCPAPVRVGRLCKWRVDELRKWIAQGCPPVNRAYAEQCRREREKELSELTKK